MAMNEIREIRRLPIHSRITTHRSSPVERQMPIAIDVSICGPCKSGKTRIAQELAEWLRGRGCTVAIHDDE